MKNTGLNFLGLVAVGIVILSTLFPFHYVLLEQTSFVVRALAKWQGVIFIFCGSLGALLFLRNSKLVTILGGAVLLAALSAFLPIDKYSLFTSVGSGVFMSLAGGAAMVLFSLKYWKKSEATPTGPLPDSNT